MKELFNETVSKIKRYDFLTGFSKRKAAEKADLTARVATLRKRNGKVGNKDLDLEIFQINAKISDVEKTIDKCKLEIKNIKKDVADSLRECYAKADSPDFLRRVQKAYDHVFDGKTTLVSLNEAGGIFGESKIVGAVVTHDKSKKCMVKECVLAGEKNQSGRIVSRPEVIVYDYDLKKTEGELRIEDDTFKRVLEKRQSSELTVFVKETYTEKVVLPSILFTAVVAVVLGYLFGAKLYSGMFGNLFYGFAAIGAVALIGFSVVGIKREQKGAVVDAAGLSAFLIAVFSAPVMIVVTGVTVKIAIPIFLACYSIVVFIVRFKLRNEERTGDLDYTLLFVFTGAFLGTAFRVAAKNVYPVNVYGKAFAWGVFGIVAIVGVALSISVFVSNKKEKTGLKLQTILSVILFMSAICVTTSIRSIPVFTTSLAVVIVCVTAYLYGKLNEK